MNFFPVDIGRFTWCFLIFVSFLWVTSFSAQGWGSHKVKLKDVEVLTLYHGKMTTGRRSPPVPQLQCIGGSAGCSAFVPQVVQCYNKGSDGNSVQWECKTDMDSSFRFGTVEVVCEGYDYPDDPYILVGSCGLEYSIDLSEEGLQKKGKQGQYNYGGWNSHKGHSYQQTYNELHQRGGISDIILVIIIGIIIYAIYRTCIQTQQFSSTNDDYPGYDSRNSGGNAGLGGGFWTGALTGGLLGYLFGNRNRGWAASGYTHRERPSYGWSGGGSGEWFSGGSGFDSSGSSSTRTASGFGGTRRR
ncbi:store-operated calcium entry-associated regulatory factor-like isoform X2 [Limulus polyphemus]|uniref:Store-operated calcium entry-associated regulatory factor n=1 Tax=Limulus polyphemus TaxID=6850 RepID=A0ABM1T5B0_LIMPO|nr:store-operated calcium entry-associated regulatory factor-like isoform X2 [Limulus polyphemus]